LVTFPDLAIARRCDHGVVVVVVIVAAALFHGVGDTSVDTSVDNSVDDGTAFDSGASLAALSDSKGEPVLLAAFLSVHPDPSIILLRKYGDILNGDNTNHSSQRHTSIMLRSRSSYPEGCCCCGHRRRRR